MHGPTETTQQTPNNLKVHLTSFVGREAELRTLRRMLSQHRLVTLIGPGGCGKTRLAVEAAHRFLDDYCDGVFFVELAGLLTPDLVPAAVAHALGVPSGMDKIVERLRNRHALLLLDNCEHVIPACVTFLNALMAQCPRLRVLTTSREVLGLAGEAVFGTPPLTVPPSDAVGAAELMQYEAVQLFADRAAAVLPDFHVSEQNARAVAQICLQLDGVPLALELAAARIRLLTSQQIAARLNDRFRLLTAGPRSGDDRHRTLRATVEWGYDLLSPREQRCFRRLAVFAGGMTLEAAEAVCAGGDIARADVMDLVAQLLDKSFLQSAGADGPHRRYHLLETLRIYGREALESSGELDALRRLHRAWCQELATEAWQHQMAPDQAVWFDRLEAEHDNLRAALRWSLDIGDVEGCLQLANRLGWFWVVRGYLREGREWFAEALPRYPDRTELRADALNAAGLLTHYVGDNAAAEALFSEAVAFRREFGDQRRLGNALNNLGMVTMQRGEYERSRLLYEEAMHIWLALGRRDAAATALSNLGTLAQSLGELERAHQLHVEALAIHRERDDAYRVSNSLLNLAQITFLLGSRNEAWQHLNEVEAICRQFQNHSSYARSLWMKGRMLLAEGQDLAQAEAALRESFRLQREAGDRLKLVDTLVALAEVTVALQRPQQAARMLGAAEAICAETGYVIEKLDRTWHERVMQAVQGALGRDAMTAAAMVGRLHSRADLPEIAGEEPPVAAAPGPGTAPGTAPGAGTGHEGLTAREIDIVRLIAAGCTIKETSHRLHLSPRTVQKHEENIRTKLGLANRASVAAWAVRQGLAETTG